MADGEPSVEHVTCHSCFSRFPIDTARLEEHLGRAYQRCPSCYASALVGPAEPPTG